jgi:hypothetical protein
MIKLIAASYIAISIAVFINIEFLSLFYKTVRQGINSRDRVKVDEKFSQITSYKKYSIVWPYTVYLLLKK